MDINIITTLILPVTFCVYWGKNALDILHRNSRRKAPSPFYKQLRVISELESPDGWQSFCNVMIRKAHDSIRKQHIFPQNFGQ